MSTFIDFCDQLFLPYGFDRTIEEKKDRITKETCIYITAYKGNDDYFSCFKNLDTLIISDPNLSSFPRGIALEKVRTLKIMESSLILNMHSLSRLRDVESLQIDKGSYEEKKSIPLSEALRSFKNLKSINVFLDNRSAATTLRELVFLESVFLNYDENFSIDVGVFSFWKELEVLYLPGFFQQIPMSLYSLAKLHFVSLGEYYGNSVDYAFLSKEQLKAFHIIAMKMNSEEIARIEQKFGDKLDLYFGD